MSSQVTESFAIPGTGSREWNEVCGVDIELSSKSGHCGESDEANNLGNADRDLRSGESGQPGIRHTQYSTTVVVSSVKGM